MICLQLTDDDKGSNSAMLWPFHSIYVKVMRSITDNITEEKLLEEIHEITRLPMYADRIKQAQAKMAQHRRRWGWMPSTSSVFGSVSLVAIVLERCYRLWQAAGSRRLCKLVGVVVGSYYNDGWLSQLILCTSQVSPIPCIVSRLQSSPCKSCIVFLHSLLWFYFHGCRIAFNKRREGLCSSMPSSIIVFLCSRVINGAWTVLAPRSSS